MPGFVTLVGAGPAKDLITVRGLKAVQDADVILYDDLIDEEILAEAKEDAELIYVGKRAGSSAGRQEEITRLLIEIAEDKRGDCKDSIEKRHIVRLKGGDGFVFGRGGEELLALQEAGIPCEIIPGVSSAIAVPEEFGIPVTHRGMSGSFTVVTGATAGETKINYKALAETQGTLVFLMGASHVKEIAEKLILNGKSGDTPVAILSKGFTPDEERIDGTLSTIGGYEGKIKTPAILVVGETAAMDLRDASLKAFRKGQKHPLKGVRITVTGTGETCRKLNGILEKEGATVATEENLRILPQPENIPDNLFEYKKEGKWIVFTSPNGVHVFFKELYRQGKDVRSLFNIKVAVIGPGTAKVLKEYGVVADFMPSMYNGETLGREIGKVITQGEEVILLRSEAGSRALPEELEKAGIQYRDCGIYKTEAIDSSRD